MSTSAAVALLTLLWGALAAVLGVRLAIGVAGGLMLAMPLLLPWRATRSATNPASLVAPAGVSGELRQAA